MQCPKCKAKGQTGNFCAECGAKLTRAEAKSDAKTIHPEAEDSPKSARAEATRGTKAADSVEASSDKATHSSVAKTVKTSAESARETSYTNASLVCGIVGLCTAWLPLVGTALSATGLALGLIVGKNEQGKPRTGTIVSGVALGLSVLVFLLYIVLAFVAEVIAANSVYDYYQDNYDTFNDWVYTEEFAPSQI